MVREVSPETVRERVEDDEDVTVVDIRQPRAYEEGHVPGAINLPLPELPRRVDERDWDADEVVCVCAIGQSSIQAARLLSSYEELDAEDVASMAGGYEEWDGDLASGAPENDPDPDASGAGTGGPEESDAPF